MKKRAVALSAVSFALAGAMLVSLAACGGDLEEAEEYVSEEVDAAAFAAAFDRENFKNVLYEGTITKESGEGNDYGKSVSDLKLVIDGIDEYMKGTETYEGSAAAENGKTEAELEAYYSEEEVLSGNGGIYPIVYLKDENGNWKKGSRFTEPYYNFYTYQPSRLLYDISFEEEDFPSFSFSAEKKGYYREENGDTSILKFKDGKVFSVEIMRNIDYGKVGVNFRFTYGGQSVALPEIG